MEKIMKTIKEIIIPFIKSLDLGHRGTRDVVGRAADRRPAVGMLLIGQRAQQ